MNRPIVGIIGNAHMISDTYKVHAGGYWCSEAIAKVTGALPLIVPSDPDLVDLDDLMSVCDGFLLTGGRANVHPEEYGEAATEAHGAFDRERDGITLPLVRRAVERGQPMFGICRGFQEVAVAFGGTLHPEIRDLPGRMNHRMPPGGSRDEIRELRQRVTLADGGPFHRLFGARSVMTNTLHGQGVMTPGAGVVIDGFADDGTPEALYIKDAPGFTLSVQWHPELNVEDDRPSRQLFEAFGDAVRSWAAGERPRILKSA
ncbi:gamma-glutamyl-gamma-aminobutyrate hydrolase family protein [Anianabacter salinae]|uniref:gamma-glutamyl-gamma-aminobutyrate hydrolase family protein n=1 Tax=Anianabacter salinae TaxID=2851023 RepID=UPI00225E4CBF|nr:gamma-glutamyl-gamma-aminobutyrate hydrolase family protein [Anianabacter salinae]MBV0914059.1 gamma-glutamyl-gamma-aminobutyrate hydrolase family protein [Anianabacter salinae]